MVVGMGMTVILMGVAQMGGVLDKGSTDELRDVNIVDISDI